MKKEARIEEKKGFTMIEILIGSAIFLVVAIGAYGAFTGLIQLAAGAQSRTLAVELADEQLEIVRNLPYTSVGLTDGIPLGVLPQVQNLSRGGFTFTVNLTIRNISLATSTATSSVTQASDKLVEVDVECPTCKDFQPVVLTGQVSPANLQSASNGGAVVVQVLNANGQPVEDANISLQSLATSSIRDYDVTNNNGTLNIIGVAAGTSMYRVIATSSGYSTDQTYAVGGPAGPNPVKPDINVLNQQVTSLTLSIDKLSSLHFSSVSPLCSAVPSYDFKLVGAKQIGASVPKYSQSLVTNGSGILDLLSMEWDTYVFTPNDASYDIAGINPYSPFTLNPNNSQNVQLVVVPKNGNALMVSVQDSTSNLPVSGATIELSNGGGYDDSEITGQGYISQTDWSGGSGQTMFATSTPNKYFADNGGVDTNTSSSSGAIQLHWNGFDPYNKFATGTLESSTFDTGGASNFYTFSWKPLSQPLLSGSGSVKFQFATKPTSTSTFAAADYLGPDGTNNSYYTVPGGAISPSLNGNEFARYMAYLTTNTATVTPSISDITFAYTSACTPPGQILFQGLSPGTYTLSISKAGYTTHSGSVVVGSGWQQQTVSIGP